MTQITDEQLALLQQRSFWQHYFWLIEDDWIVPVFAHRPIVFSFPDEFVLHLLIDERFWEMTLYLVHPSLAQPAEIAWDDQAHFHPHVFRWNELLKICTYLSKQPVFVQQPYLPLLLLYRFAPITAADDGPGAQAILHRAWHMFSLLEQTEIEVLERWNNRQDQEVVWAQDSDFGWVLTGYDAYSLRNPENDEFPFELLNMLVTGLEHIGSE